MIKDDWIKVRTDFLTQLEAELGAEEFARVKAEGPHGLLDSCIAKLVEGFTEGKEVERLKEVVRFAVSYCVERPRSEAKQAETLSDLASSLKKAVEAALGGDVEEDKQELN